LIDAFKSTLDELRYAHLLVHVVDLSNKNWEQQINTVNTLVNEMHMSKPMLYAFNKIDLLAPMEIDLIKPLLEKYSPFVLTSTKTEDGLDTLREFLHTWKPVKVELPHESLNESE
jgi:GTP-binding protein HflX